MAGRDTEKRERLEGDYSAAFIRSDTAPMREYHIHDDFEIMFITSENAVCGVGEQRYELRKNSLLLFNNMDLHRIYQTRAGSYERYVVWFKPRFLEALSTENTDLLKCFYYRPTRQSHVFAPEEEQVRELLRLLDRAAVLYQERKDNAYGTDLEIKFALGELLIYVNRLYQDRIGAESGGEPSHYRRIYPVMLYIQGHFSEELSLDQLSERFYFNKNYLCTLFRKVTGQTPIQYLLRYRMDRAKELLLTGLPVEQVCSRVGFRSSEHFSRYFKRIAGVPPSRYGRELGE